MPLTCQQSNNTPLLKWSNTHVTHSLLILDDLYHGLSYLIAHYMYIYPERLTLSHFIQLSPKVIVPGFELTTFHSGVHGLNHWATIADIIMCSWRHPTFGVWPHQSKRHVPCSIPHELGTQITRAVHHIFRKCSIRFDRNSSILAGLLVFLRRISQSHPLSPTNRKTAILDFVCFD